MVLENGRKLVEGKTFYIAGPMTGMKNCNFEAFLTGEDLLVELGAKKVWNPVQHNLATWPDIESWEGFAEGHAGGHPDFDLNLVCNWDINKVLDPDTDAVAFLPGWEDSVGANAEHAVALFAGKEILYIDPRWGYVGQRAHRSTAVKNFQGRELHPITVEDIKRDTITSSSISGSSLAFGEVRVTNEKTGGAKGSKLARFDLIPEDVMWKLAELYGKGAAKYEERNWEKGYNWSLSYAAARRHMALFWGGEDMDEEMELPHLICAMFHMCALVRFMEAHRDLDDRP